MTITRLPVTPARYLPNTLNRTPSSAGVRRPRRGGVVARMRRSPFATDLRANRDVLMVAAALLIAAVVGLAIGLNTRDAYMAWDGIHHIAN